MDILISFLVGVIIIVLVFPLFGFLAGVMTLIMFPLMLIILHQTNINLLKLKKIKTIDI